MTWCNRGIYVGSANVTVVAGIESNVNIVLKKQPCPVPPIPPHPCCCCCKRYTHFSGAIFDRTSKEIVAGATISVYCGEYSQTQDTNLSGQFSFMVPTACRELTITISKSGYTKRYIGSYRIGSPTNNNFYLLKKTFSR